jgi:hypothetical protein
MRGAQGEHSCNQLCTKPQPQPRLAPPKPTAALRTERFTQRPCRKLDELNLVVAATENAEAVKLLLNIRKNAAKTHTRKIYNCVADVNDFSGKMLRILKRLGEEHPAETLPTDSLPYNARRAGETASDFEKSNIGITEVGKEVTAVAQRVGSLVRSTNTSERIFGLHSSLTLKLI